MTKPAIDDFAAIVVAAGRATRFGDGIPKQYRDLAGRSVLERSIGLLAQRPAVSGVVVAVAPEELDGPRARKIAALPVVRAVVAGGETRAESVRRGLAGVGDAEFVLVHDAARPLASAALVQDVMDATREHGASLPGLVVPDTVKRIDDAGRVLETLDRSEIRLAQTPQGARVDWLLQALERRPDLTDEAAALERDGRPVHVVPGDAANLKITRPADLEEARRMLTGDESDGLRVGLGFDVHPFAEGRELILGGVAFPGPRGLDGHSDADVVLHAAMDAVLGAAAMGDIGCLFPPEDPAFKGASSVELARTVAARLSDEGYAIVNLDITLLAEVPKIRPHHARMRQAIADSFGIHSGLVGLKATTVERLGAIGREEGIACQAVAMIRRVRPAPR